MAVPHIKYTSIENYENAGARRAVFSAVPADEPFVVHEKVDGANLQLLFRPHEPLLVGRRNGWVADGEQFFGVRAVLEEYSAELGALQAWADGGHTLKVYGELFGPRVLKRVPYQPGILFFDIRVDDELLAPAAMRDFLDARGLAHMAVPQIALLPNSEAVVEWVQSAAATRGVPSVVAPGHIAEGVVIRPHRGNWRLKTGYAMLKHKSADFLEKECVPAGKASGAPVNPLQEEFKAYCTANRAASVVSKLGPPRDKKAIAAQYIPALRADALEDFAKDHPDLGAKDVHMAAKARGVNLFHLFLEHMQ